MAEDKLSGKAGLDTTEFKTGIAGMNRELRVLESGFRASAAGLADWASDATGLESRIKSLNSQMDIQKQKVAATRAEYERIKAEKGENSRAAQDLEIKLNKETETLGKMEQELVKTQGALGEMQSGTEEAGESVDDLGDQTDETGEKLISFQDVMDGMGAIAGAVIGIVVALAAAIAAVAVGIGAMVFNAAGAAAELVDLSAKTGISTTRLQELSYVGDQVGTSLDTITGAQARLIRSMADAADGGKDQVEAFKTLGVSATDVNGNLRDTQDVFAEVIDALGKIENPAERDALAMELFGKSAQELNPLIKAGSEELARLADEAHEVGAVMDEDAVTGLEAFDDTMASIQAGMKGTLGTLAAEFLPIFQEVGTVLQDLFKSEEFKKGIGEFSELIKGVVSVALDVLGKLVSGDTEGALAAIFGVENASSILSFIESIRSFLVDTLIPFVTTHAEQIKSVLIGIGAAFAAFVIISSVVSFITGLIATVTALAGTFTAAGGVIGGIVALLGGPVTLIIGAIALAIGLFAAAWKNNWGGIRETLTALWEKSLKPALTQLWTWLSTNIPAALQTLSKFWKDTLLPAIRQVWEFLNTSVFPLFEAIGTFINAVFSLAFRALAGVWQNVLLPAFENVWRTLKTNVFPIFTTIGDYISKTLQPIFNTLSNFLKNNLAPAFTTISSAISGVIGWLTRMAGLLNNLQLPGWMTPGSPTPWELGLIGINKAMRELNKTLPVLSSNLNLQPRGAGSLGLGSSSTQNDQFQFFAPVVIQGETTPGSLGAVLKGVRY